MNSTLEELKKIRGYLIKNFRHINAVRSPIFVVLSIVIGAGITVCGAMMIETAWGMGLVVLGCLGILVNILQLIYKNYI